MTKTPHQQIESVLKQNIFTADFIAKCCGLKITTFYVYKSINSGANCFTEKHVDKLKKNLDKFMLGTIKV